jgi:hypothetical protein
MGFRRGRIDSCRGKDAKESIFLEKSAKNGLFSPENCSKRHTIWTGEK